MAESYTARCRTGIPYVWMPLTESVIPERPLSVNRGRFYGVTPVAARHGRNLQEAHRDTRPIQDQASSLQRLCRCHSVAAPLLRGIKRSIRSC